MHAAVLYGLMASAAFPIGVALGLFFDLPRRVVASVVAFGAGVLIVALVSELMAEALAEGSLLWATTGLFTGAVTYVGVDRLLNRAAAASPRLKGREPKDVKPGAAAIPETPAEATVSGTAVLVGAVLDGVPETAAIGMGLASEPGRDLGLVLLGAVFLANLPEALASTVGMRKAGRSKVYIAVAWGVVTLVCAAACVAGYVWLAGLPPAGASFMLALAAGGVLAMLSDTMFPEALKNGGPWVALATTFGFACAFLLAELVE